ncbi:MAG: BlaI/MecI/CopY family transcriptional regulator [Eubacterium sp.]|nr:BlaI/MecI/CopY family transcriptional regulator [Eubacterium sp.]
MQQISDYELELMKVIWANGQTALYAEIVTALSDKGMNWTKNTIITLLSRLIDKGLLKTNKIGHRNRYTAIVSADEYQTSQTETFLHKVYEGNAKGLVSTLIQKDLLSAADYEDLKKYWKDLNHKSSFKD